VPLMMDDSNALMSIHRDWICVLFFSSNHNIVVIVLYFTCCSDFNSALL